MVRSQPNFFSSWFRESQHRIWVSTRYPNLTLFVVSREMNRKWVPFGIVWCGILSRERVEEREAKSRVRVTANPDYRPGIKLMQINVPALYRTTVARLSTL